VDLYVSYLRKKLDRGVSPPASARCTGLATPSSRARDAARNVERGPHPHQAHHRIRGHLRAHAIPAWPGHRLRLLPRARQPAGRATHPGGQEHDQQPARGRQQRGTRHEVRRVRLDSPEARGRCEGTQPNHETSRPPRHRPVRRDHPPGRGSVGHGAGRGWRRAGGERADVRPGGRLGWRDAVRAVSPEGQGHGPRARPGPPATWYRGPGPGGRSGSPSRGSGPSSPTPPTSFRLRSP